jgi:hypothetical protein
LRLCVAAALSVLAGGCSGTTLVMTNPRDARLVVDGTDLPTKKLRYGRWVGNEYEVDISAPGFESERLHLDVALGERAATLAFFLGYSLVGLPLIPFVLPFNGEIDRRIYVSLRPREDTP